MFSCNELLYLLVVTFGERPGLFMLVTLLSIDLRDTFLLQLRTDLSITDAEVQHFDLFLGGLNKA